MIDAVLSFDALALLFIQEHLRFEALNPVARFITALGNGGLVWILLALVLLVFRQTRKDSLYCLPVLGLATLINNVIIKNIVQRVRPYEVVEGLTILIAPESSWSFPSGHSCSSFAMATAIFLAFRGRGGAWAYLPATLIALSRLYVGVHYPTDVLIGAVIGTLVAVLCYNAYKKIRVKTGF